MGRVLIGMLRQMSADAAVQIERLPWLPVTMGLALGILAETRWEEPPWVWLTVAAVASGTALLAPSARRLMLLIVLSFFLGHLLYASKYERPPQDDILNLFDGAATLARVRGTVLSAPQTSAGGMDPFAPWIGDRSTLVVDLSSVYTESGWRGARGRIRVTLSGRLESVEPGNGLELFGRLYRFEPPDNPGVFDWARWNQLQGIRCGLTCESPEAIAPMAGERSNSLSQQGFKLKARLLTHIRFASEADEMGEGSLLDALVLGQRQATPRLLNEMFIRAGCAHYLSASGAHLAAVALAAFFIGRLMGWRRSRIALSVCFIMLIYGVVAEPRPPILRSAIQALCLASATLLGRRADGVNLLCLAAVILLILSPGVLFDVGCQLSFVATFGVMRLGPALATTARERAGWFFHRGRGEEVNILRQIRREQPLRRHERILRWLGLGIAYSTGAWLMALPIIAHHFYRAQFWGWLTSLLVAPLVVIVVNVGLAAALIGPFLPGVLDVFRPTAIHLARLLIRAVEPLGSLPAADAVMRPFAPWALILWYAALFLWIWIARSLWREDAAAGAQKSTADDSTASAPTLTTQSPKTNDGAVNRVSALRRASLRLWLLGLVFLCLAGSSPFWPAGWGRLRLTVLSVGRGQATLIELPDGDALCFDLGADRTTNVGEGLLLPAIASKGIRHIDEVWISHPNLDHYNGLPGLLAHLSIGRVIVSPFFAHPPGGSASGDRVVARLTSQGQKVESLDPTRTAWIRSGVLFEVLWPPADPPGFLRVNDTSIVLRLTYAGRSILLTGDIEDVAQQILVRNAETDDATSLKGDVLLMPHHGSLRPSSRIFVNAVDPRVAIRSARQMSAEMPKEYWDLMAGRAHFNTADEGAVEVTIDEKGIEVRGFRSEGPPLWIYRDR